MPANLTKLYFGVRYITSFIKDDVTSVMRKSRRKTAKIQRARTRCIIPIQKNDKRFPSRRYFDRSFRAAISHDSKNHDRRISSLENGPAALTQRRSARRTLLRALRTKSILFSARLRAPAARWHLRLSPADGETVTVGMRADRVAASKTGYGESAKEGTIAAACGAQ